MPAKLITLASLWKRIGAHAIDLVCTIALTLVCYFSFVLPLSFDQQRYKDLSEQARQGELESSLFVEYRNTFAVNPAAAFTFANLASLSETEQFYSDQAQKVYLLDNLHLFYTEKYAAFGGTNLSEDIFQQEILRLGSKASNIAAFAKAASGHYAVAPLDPKKASTTISFVLAEYKKAVAAVDSSPRVKGPNDEGNRLMLFAIAMVLPTLFASAFIFTFLIPLLAPNGKTLGKMALHLVVLTQDGYQIKKWVLLPRFLCYALIELIGGILSFGGTFLISYTMAMFQKKHRCFHDFLARTVVADERESLFFANRYDEELYEQHLKREGIADGQESA